jgi:predicted aspartyl protease
MLIRGSFDPSGSPVIPIEIAGPTGGRCYEATIDTGFTGFVVVNIGEMIHLGLKTGGAAEVTLGDGRTVPDLMAEASVAVGAVTKAGTILLSETSNEVLIGLDFLRTFRLALILTATAVILYDEAETLAAVFRALLSTPLGTPNTAPSATSGEV